MEKEGLQKSYYQNAGKHSFSLFGVWWCPHIVLTTHSEFFQSKGWQVLQHTLSPAETMHCLSVTKLSWSLGNLWWSSLAESKIYDAQWQCDFILNSTIQTLFFLSTLSTFLLTFLIYCRHDWPLINLLVGFMYKIL